MRLAADAISLRTKSRMFNGIVRAASIFARESS
jgi:hypothetical protein